MSLKDIYEDLKHRMDGVIAYLVGLINRLKSLMGVTSSTVNGDQLDGTKIMFTYNASPVTASMKATGQATPYIWSIGMAETGLITYSPYPGKQQISQTQRGNF
jgi:hypothetical protein